MHQFGEYPLNGHFMTGKLNKELQHYCLRCKKGASQLFIEAHIKDLKELKKVKK